jgi:hypothetical protein
MIDISIISNHSVGFLAYLSYICYLKYFYFEFMLNYKLRDLVTPFLFFKLVNRINHFHNGERYFRSFVIPNLRLFCNMLSVVLSAASGKEFKNTPFMLSPTGRFFVTPTLPNSKLVTKTSLSYKQRYKESADGRLSVFRRTVL